MRRPDFGPLHERDFRLLFLSSTISFTGSAFTNVALAFAVLDLTGSKADLGFVLAARTLPTVVFLLVGGIWADRLPRHHVMVASNALSGLSQATIAALLFSGHARVWQLAALAAVNGASSAFFFPAASGITPQTVPESLLQQANAVLRLGRNSAWIVGGALAGLVVAATSPATGIAVDSASFLVAATLTAAMRIPSSLHLRGSHFIADLALGWREFASRAWLWAIVLQFGLVNAVEQGSQGVLGPAVAKEDFGGAAAWGLIASVQALGLVVGGIVMLRLRPRRLLLVATLGFADIATAIRARSPRAAAGRRCAGVRGRPRHRDVRRALGHEHAAGDPARPSVARLFLRCARLGRADPARARDRGPGRRRDRHEGDVVCRRDDQPRGDASRAPRP